MKTEPSIHGPSPAIYTLFAVLCLAAVAFMFQGCAYLASDTKTPTLEAGTTNVVAYATTHARVWTLFDAQSQLTKFRNSNGGPTNNFSSGTAMSGVNESSTSSNLVQIFQAAAAIAAKAP